MKVNKQIRVLQLPTPSLQFIVMRWCYLIVLRNSVKFKPQLSGSQGLKPLGMLQQIRVTFDEESID